MGADTVSFRTIVYSGCDLLDAELVEWDVAARFNVVASIRVSRARGVIRSATVDVQNEEVEGDTLENAQSRPSVGQGMRRDAR